VLGINPSFTTPDRSPDSGDDEAHGGVKKVGILIACFCVLLFRKATTFGGSPLQTSSSRRMPRSLFSFVWRTDRKDIVSIADHLHVMNDSNSQSRGAVLLLLLFVSLPAKRKFDGKSISRRRKEKAKRFSLRNLHEKHKTRQCRGRDVRRHVRSTLDRFLDTGFQFLGNFLPT